MPNKKTIKDVIHISHESHNLPITLTEKDRSTKARQIAESLESLKSIDTARKATAAEFSARASAIGERIDKLGHEILSGKALKPVDCELNLNYTKQLATLVRTDCGKIVEDRTMTNEEKQMQMDFEKQEAGDA